MKGSFGLRVWGARGSLPRMARGQERHGGNTVCLEVIHDGPEHLILDAGTGLPNLGAKILRDHPTGGPVHLFLTHYHWDHILGLPLFGPVYREGFDIHLYGMNDAGALRAMLDTVFSAAYSPIYGPDNLLGHLVLPEQSRVHQVGNVTVELVDIEGVHPGGCLVVRLTRGSKTIVYAPDVELRDRSVVDRFVAACAGCDLLVCGMPLSETRFVEAVGWGHSSLSVVHDAAVRAGVKRLLGIHFDPLSPDDELERARDAQQRRAPEVPIELAREGSEVWL